MTRIHSLPEVVDDIRQLINLLGTQKEVAEHLDISEQHLTDILRGRRKPGPRLLLKLGYIKTEGYESIKGDVGWRIIEVKTKYGQWKPEEIDD